MKIRKLTLENKNIIEGEEVMKLHKSKTLLLLMLIFTLILLSTNIVFAAKPEKIVNIELTDVTSSSVTFDFDWDKIGVYSIDVTVIQFSGPGYSTGYILGMDSISLPGRTSSYSGSKTINFNYAQDSPFPASGSYGLIRLNLLDRKGNVFQSVFSNYFLIP
jgi:hypothetical protein